jgi:predicted regulator of amino acid metabolism with ACT domain
LSKKKKGSVFNVVKMTTKEFAKMVGVKRRTVCNYCLRIEAGQEDIFKFLKEKHGLVSIMKLYSEKWQLTVNIPVK